MDFRPLIASLTGGLYCDVTVRNIINIIHIYIWVSFLVILIFLHLVFQDYNFIQYVYSFLIGTFILCIKLLIRRLHFLLDNCSPVDNIFCSSDDSKNSDLPNDQSEAFTLQNQANTQNNFHKASSEEQMHIYEEINETIINEKTDSDSKLIADKLTSPSEDALTIKRFHSLDLISLTTEKQNLNPYFSQSSINYQSQSSKNESSSVSQYQRPTDKEEIPVSINVTNEIIPLLRRRPGFRRRTTIIERPHTSNSTAVEVHQVEDSTVNLMETSGMADEINQNIQLPKPSLEESSPSSALITNTTPLVDQSARLNAFAKAILEDYLAHMMGVRSLADAGLTVPQCLRQILNSTASDNSELNAEESDFLMYLTTTAIQQAISQHSNAGVVTQLNLQQPSTSEISPAINDTARLNTSSEMVDLIEPNPISNEVDTSLTNPDPFVVRRFHSRPRVSTIPTPQTTPGRPYISLWEPNNLITLLRREMRNARRTRPTNALRLFPFSKRTFKMKIDRIDLLALFDLDSTIIEMVLCILSAMLVALLGMQLLKTKMFQHTAVMGLYFVIASTQFGLIKSVQPDAASPEHGHNRIIIFSRSLYFCLLALGFIICEWISPHMSQKHSMDLTSKNTSMAIFKDAEANVTRLLGLLVGKDETTVKLAEWNPAYAFLLTTKSHFSLQTHAPKMVENVSRIFWWWDTSAFCKRNCILPDGLETYTFQPLYGINLNTIKMACLMKAIIYYLILLIPVWHLFGLLPQVNTVAIYLLEQCDMHLLGGQGTVGLRSALFTIIRAILVTFVGFLILQQAFKSDDFENHFAMVLYWGFMFAMSHLLSRLPSNIHLFELLIFGINIHTGKPRTTIEGIHHTSFIFFRAVRSSVLNFVECLSAFAWSKHEGIVMTSSRKCPEESKRNVSLRILSTHASKPSLTSYQETEIAQDFETFKSNSLPPMTQSGFETLKSDEMKKSQSSSYLGKIKKSKNEQVDSNSKTVHGAELDSEELITPYDTLYTSENEIYQLTPMVPTTRNPRTPNLFRMNLPRRQIRRGDHSWCTQEAVLNTNVGISIDEDLEDDTDHPIDGHSKTGLSVLELYRRLNDHDPSPPLIRNAFCARVRTDFLMMCPFWFVFGCLLQLSSRKLIQLTNIHNIGQIIETYLIWFFIAWGFTLHYIWPKIRQPHPWRLFGNSWLPMHYAGGLCWNERLFLWFQNFYIKILFPTLTLLTIDNAIQILKDRYGSIFGGAMSSLITLRMLRSGFNSPSQLYLQVLVTQILLASDLTAVLRSEGFALDFLLCSFLVVKAREFYAKLCFIFIYLAPFHLSVGSCLHIVIQLIAIPHFVLIFLNVFISTLFSAPLEPIMATAVFITSYVRPIMFWEKRHKTQRLEIGNTSLASQVRSVTEDQVMTNLNAILYEHLARQLQRNLAGDIALGRFAGGNVQAGDMFILCSEQFNCIIHIVETGRDLVTFQLRGLEFTGTYCHSREAAVLHESINTGWRPDKPNKSSSTPGNLCTCPSIVSDVNSRSFVKGIKQWCSQLFLPFPRILKMRTIAYESVTEPYVFRAYTIFDHSATSTLQCIVYYATNLTNLPARLKKLRSLLESNDFVISAAECNSPNDNEPSNSPTPPIKVETPRFKPDPFNSLNGLSFNPVPDRRSSSFDSVSSIGCGSMNKRHVVFWKNKKEFSDALGPWIEFCRTQNLIDSQTDLHNNQSSLDLKSSTENQGLIHLGDGFASRLLFNGDDDPASPGFDQPYEFHLKNSAVIDKGECSGKDSAQTSDEMKLTSALCFALCSVGRRLLLGDQLGPSALRIPIENFLLKLHDLFKGDARVPPSDEWIFSDLPLLQECVTPASRMALKLYRDHFTWKVFNSHQEAYTSIQNIERSVVICPESDPRWRYAVLNDVSQLFSFRRLQDKEAPDQARFRLITLKKCRVQLRVVKINSECARGFWAAQQREQIFLRSRNSERGSIQSAVPVLRNLISSSADQPIGYPIYVSPLITSFTGDNSLHRYVVGSELHFCGDNKEADYMPPSIPLSSCCIKYKCKINPECCRKRSKSSPISTRATAGAENSSARSIDSPPNINDDKVVDLTLRENPSSRINFQTPNFSASNSQNTTAAQVHEKEPVLRLMDHIVEIKHVAGFEHILGSGLLKRLVYPSNQWEKIVLNRIAFEAFLENQGESLETLNKIGWIIKHRWTPCHLDITQRSLCHRSLALIKLATKTESSTLNKELDGLHIVIYESDGLKDIDSSSTPIP